MIFASPRVLTLTAALLLSTTTLAQNNGGAGQAAPPAAPAPALPAAPVDAPKLSVDTVSSAITVDAVLLPRSVTRRLFGNEIGKRFVAVQMTVSNRSSSAGLILHSVFLDYSQWLFSGTFSGSGLAPQQVSVQSFQQQNNASQVASAEARLVRGDLADAQTWTTRNWFIRAATLIGTGAAGFQFLTTDAQVISGISTYGNQIVPALSVLWPDNTQQQLDRISDFGFQDNRVVGKNSSSTIVAFFPLDRFLTPALQKVYLKSPASFFVPSEMLLDSKSRTLLLKPLQSAGLVSSKPDVAAGQITSALMKYQTNIATGKAPLPIGAITVAGEPDVSGDLLVQVLDKISLNNIRVVIGGSMTVDVATVPATISSVTFATTDKWTSGSAAQTGTLAGNFLSDATLTFGGDAGPAFTSVTVDPKSTDTSLIFHYTLGTAVTNCQSLTITATKKASDGTTTSSAAFTTAIPITATPCPSN